MSGTVNKAFDLCHNLQITANNVNLMWIYINFTLILNSVGRGQKKQWICAVQWYTEGTAQKGLLGEHKIQMIPLITDTGTHKSVTARKRYTWAGY